MWRSNLSDEEKNRVRKYDRERKRAREAESTMQSTAPSYYSVLNKSKKIRVILGHSPKMHMPVLNHVLKHSKRSPHKAKLLNYSPRASKFITPKRNCNETDVDRNIPSTLRKIAVLKSKRKHTEAKNLRVELKSQFTIKSLADQTGDNDKSLHRLLSSPKKRTKEFYICKLTEVVRDEVKRIFNDEELSYTLPDVRFADYCFMSMTLKEAYQVYLKKCQTERKVAESTFCSMKPNNIRTVHETPLRGCKCEYCQNFGLLRETLIGLGFKGIPKNHAAAIEVTWCKFRQGEAENESDKEDYKYHDIELPRKQCVQRNCKKCGVGHFEKEIITRNIKLIRKLKNVKWKQWQQVKYQAPEGKKLNKKMDMVSHYGSSSCLVATYMKQLKSMSRHQFMKIWQLRNFNLAKEHLQPSQLLCVHDFSQNILLYYQDEVGSKHWDHEQMSLHPSSLLMKCITCNGLIHEEVIHLTPDKTHDHKAVEQFVQTTLHHLEQKGIEIKEIIEFTDHASSQYKSKFSFFNLSNMQIPTTRHYFGVKHGKGPSDCAGANYKKFVKKTILTGHNFDNCEDLGNYSMMQYVEQSVTHGTHKWKWDVYAHSLKSSFYHSKIINRKADPPKLRTLKGCRDWMHAVRNTGIPGVVEWRDFDCCCSGCVSHSGDCKNKNIADSWKLILPHKPYHKRIERVRCKPLDAILCPNQATYCRKRKQGGKGSV